MLCSALVAEPVIERVRRDRRGQRAEVIRRRAGNRGELAEAPMGQGGSAARRLECEVVVRERRRPEVAGVDGARFGAVASGAGRLVERVDRGVPFIGRAQGPFAMRGGRRHSRDTSPGHVSAPFCVPWGDEMDSSFTPVGVKGWPGRPQRR